MKTLYISERDGRYDGHMAHVPNSKPVKVGYLQIDALLAMTSQRMNDVLQELYNQ